MTMDQYPDCMVSVYVVKLVQGEWVKDPLEGLVYRLNASVRRYESARIYRTPLVPPKDVVVEAFMLKDCRRIALVCHSLSKDGKILADLQISVDASYDFLTRGGRNRAELIVAWIPRRNAIVVKQVLYNICLVNDS